MMGRNWVRDNQDQRREHALDLIHEYRVRQIMEQRVAVWLATRIKAAPTLSPLPSPSRSFDERPNTSSCDETCPPAA